MFYTPLSSTDVPDRHPVTLFANFWSEHLGDGFVPLRQHIDPIKIPSVLPWIMLLERVEGDDLQFRHRLVGTGCREIIGSDYTGRLIADRDFIKVFRGVFPVSVSGESVDQVFTVMAPEDLRLNMRLMKSDRTQTSSQFRAN